nr:hypothetical protein [Mimivirus sp.]
MSYLNQIHNTVIEPEISPYQKWKPTKLYPYPNNFTQAPSREHQIMVYYNGKPQLQTLSPNTGPIMFPEREINANPINGWERKHTIYPKNLILCIQQPIPYQVHIFNHISIYHKEHPCINLHILTYI